VVKMPHSKGTLGLTSLGPGTEPTWQPPTLGEVRWGWYMWVAALGPGQGQTFCEPCRAVPLCSLL
jgi:hypothetical protein